MKTLTYCFLSGLLLASHCYGSDRYFLCGSDEDGCLKGKYQYCFCIPYNELDANKPHCLDFDEFTCTPLLPSSKCKPSFIFRNQAECLATIFQSEPTPPCTIVTHAFCLQEHVTQCDPDGRLDSCR
jgi:hypothetical protein